MNQYISKCISVFVFSPTNFEKRIHPLTYILGLTEVMAGDWRLRLHILISFCCRFSNRDQRRQSKSSGCEETDPESAQTEPRHHEAALQPPAQVRLQTYGKTDFRMRTITEKMVVLSFKSLL